LSSFALLLTAIPVLAHHSIAAEFDTRDTVTLTGVFTKIDWINPHIYFYIEAKDDSGNVTKWAMESYPTGFFSPRGNHQGSVQNWGYGHGRPLPSEGWNTQHGVSEGNDLTKRP